MLLFKVHINNPIAFLHNITVTDNSVYYSKYTNN